MDAQLPPSLLVANRGEIAARIMRTARRLGIRAIAVYSDADRGALHVREADQAVRIGPAAAGESYLRGDAILAAARQSGAAAVHPGYGFLSENADFAQAVIDAGLIWVGPPPDAIRQLGDKVAARRLAAELGVPVAAGVDRDDGDEALAEAIERMGLPVMIKAAAGGGGRGMRLLRRPEDAPDGLAAAVASARREAEAAFGDGALLVERALTEGRHVEVQVLCDGQGGGLHLGERDCTVQRRRQKVIEEAPSPAVDANLRERLGAAAISIAQAAGYQNAGTVEFLLQPDGDFVFLEVNTRLQVEHPVTEAVTGLDLVELQLRIAAGESLPLSQTDLTLNGHAVEVRLYAEDPQRGYAPSTGRLARFEAGGGGARIDAGVASGDTVTPHYDSMLAKIITHAATQAEAVEAAAQALEGQAVRGVTTNALQLIDILRSEDFAEGRIDVGWLDRIELPPSDAPSAALAAAALHEAAGAWRSSGALERRYFLHGREHQVSVRRTTGSADGWLAAVGGGDGEEVAVAVAGDQIAIRRSGQSGQSDHPESDAEVWSYEGDGDVVRVGLGRRSWAFSRTLGRKRSGRARGGGANELRSPMPGSVAAVLVAEGDAVEAGQTLVVLEAMKMEHLLAAPISGAVQAVHCAAGDTVDEDQVLVELAVDGGAD